MPDRHIYLDEGMKRWIYRTARRHYWRVASWYDLDDLIQEGFLAYQKCQVKYARLARKRNPRPEDRRNFMALVMRAFENRIHDLASKRTIQTEDAVSRLQHDSHDFTPEEWLESRGAQNEAADALYQSSVRDMPRTVKAIVDKAIRDVRVGIDVDVGAVLTALRKENQRLALEEAKKRRREKSIDTVSQISDDSKVVVRRRLRRTA